MVLDGIEWHRVVLDGIGCYSHHGVRVVVPGFDEQAHGVGGGLEEGDQGVPLVPHPDHHLLGHGGVGKVCVDLKDWLVLSEATLNKLLIMEAPLKLSTDLNGHCPNSDCTPPLSTGHSGALYFRTELSNFVKSPC